MANLYPLLHNSNTRTWFLPQEGDPQCAPFVSVHRVIITRVNARILLKSFAVIGDTEPNPNAYPLTHFRDGMDIAVLYGEEGEPHIYNDKKIVAVFHNAISHRSWISDLSIIDPKRRGIIPIWMEAWSDMWQLEFS